MSERSLLIRGANIWTGDRRRPFADALLLSKGRIISVGTANDVSTHPQAKDARELCLEGETVIPGMTDAHLHLMFHARQSTGISLLDTRSIGEALELLKKAAKVANPGDWIHGVRYNDTFWEENRPPTRHELDAAVRDHPLLLTRVCTHIQVANSAALAAAGIPEEDWGDGLLLEKKGDPVIKTMERWRSGSGRELDLVEKACREFARYGVTELHTCSAPEYGALDELSAYQRLRIEGRLPVRVVLYEERMPALNFMSGLGDDWVRYGGFKLFLDGSLGGRTAALSSPYADDPGNRGILNHEWDQLANTVREAHNRGLQMLIHAIGDEALDQAIGAISLAYGDGSCPCALPHRINHVMICRPDQVAKLKGLGVVLDVQPAFVPSEIEMATARLGEERLSWAYPWRTFVDSGLVVTGSSDCPVDPPNPWRGIWGAVCRVNDRGDPRGGWLPEQRLTLAQALELWTVNGALAAGEGGRRGRIAPGFLADLAVLDRDIFQADPMGLKNVEALLTLAGGKITHGEILSDWDRI